MKITVIYHNADFDGLFCREIARKFFPDAELIGWNFGQPKIPMPAEGQVCILDLSPDCLCDNPALEALAWNRIIWIDHHKSSIEKWPSSIHGYRIDGVAACRLAWQYWSVGPGNAHQSLANKQDFIDRKVTEPYAVQLAGEYDIWDKRNPDAELLQMGLRSQELTDQTWKMLLDDSIPVGLEGTGMEDCALSQSEIVCRHLLSQGRGVQYAKNTENAQIITSSGFDIDFEGLHFLACNHARYNSHLFTAGLKPEHDACLGFAWRGGRWTVSLYHAPGKEHHDLSVIAVKYGGGGHRGACGFQMTKLPWLP